MKNYIPKEFKIGNLEALIRKHDSWILGLSRIEEYTLPDYESGNIEKNERIKVSMLKMARRHFQFGSVLKKSLAFQH